MLVPNRHASSNSYRYGFQGQEKDDEIKGEGNSLNYTFRMHDPRVGRFFAVDPLFKTYPSNSPYAFSENNVISRIEREGLEATFYLIGMKEIEGHNYFVLVQAYQTGQDEPDKIKKQLGERNYVYSSDGHWHRIPNQGNYMNPSMQGETAEEVGSAYNKLDFADKEADMAGALSVMEDMGNLLSVFIGSTSLNRSVKNTGVKNIVKNSKINTVKTITALEKNSINISKIKAQINERHILSSDKVAKAGKTSNSTMTTKEILDEDVLQYNQGNFTNFKDGDVKINGRIYGVKNEGKTLFPRSGGSIDFIDLTQGQIKAIQLIKNTPAENLQKAIKGAKISEADFNYARDFISKY